MGQPDWSGGSGSTVFCPPLADSIDEYVRIGESTTEESLQKFVKVVVNIFFKEYLRSPNSNDIARLLALTKNVDFQECWGALIACIGNGKIA